MFDQFAQPGFAQMLAAYESNDFGKTREVAYQVHHRGMLLRLDVAALLDLPRDKFQDYGRHISLRFRIGFHDRGSDHLAQRSHDVTYELSGGNHGYETNSGMEANISCSNSLR